MPIKYRNPEKLQGAQFLFRSSTFENARGRFFGFFLAPLVPSLATACRIVTPLLRLVVLVLVLLLVPLLLVLLLFCEAYSY